MSADHALYVTSRGAPFAKTHHTGGPQTEGGRGIPREKICDEPPRPEEERPPHSTRRHPARRTVKGGSKIHVFPSPHDAPGKSRQYNPGRPSSRSDAHRRGTRATY